MGNKRRRGTRGGPPKAIPAVLVGGKYLESGEHRQTLSVLLSLGRVANTLLLIDTLMADPREHSVEAMRRRFSGGLLMLATTFEAAFVARDQRVKNLTLMSTTELGSWRDHPLVEHISRSKGLWGSARNQAVFHFGAADMPKWFRREHQDWETLIATNSNYGNSYFALADSVVSLHGAESDIPPQDLIDSFVEKWPRTQGFRVRHNYSNREIHIYFSCLAATHIAAVAFCDIVGKMFDEHMQRMDVRTGLHMPNDAVHIDLLPPRKT